MAVAATNRPSLLGCNLMLTSLLALLSYVPFEWVAKATLLLCVGLFIVDPFPPISRLVSLLATLVVAGITKTYNAYKLQEQEKQEELEDRSDPDENTSVVDDREVDPTSKDKHA